MKITKNMLKKLVKEEYSNLLDEQGYTPGDQTMMSDEDFEDVERGRDEREAANWSKEHAAWLARPGQAADKHAAWLAKLKKGGVSGDELRRQAHTAKSRGPLASTIIGGAGPVKYSGPSHDSADARAEHGEFGKAMLGRGKTKTIQTPQGDLEVPMLPGETTASPKFKARVKAMMKADASTMRRTDDNQGYDRWHEKSGQAASALMAPRGKYSRKSKMPGEVSTERRRGSKLSDFNPWSEGKITKNMLKKLVQEELGFLRTRIMLEHGEDTGALAADVVSAEDVGDATAGFHHILENIQADVTEILELLKSPSQLQEAKPVYKGSKSAEERLHGKTKPKKETKPEKSGPEKKLSSLETRIKRYKKNIKDGKDVKKNETLLKRAERELKRLATGV